MQTGRIPNRSGMTTVAFQGQGGGLPAAEWTLASVLKQGDYPDLFHRQMASGRGRLRIAQRPRLRRYEICQPLSSERLHLRRSDLVPYMDPELRAMFQRVTTGALSGKAGEKAVEEFKIKASMSTRP